jgi:DNA-binding SARP family transcriptional activator
VEFGFLGPLAVWRDGREVPIGAAKQRALLTLLLLRRGELVPTEALLDGLWGERPPATGVKVVQVYVSQLRKALGEGLVETRPAGYRVRLDPGALDADRFEGLLERGRGLLAGGEAGHAGDVLREALALWRGPPLAEFRYEAFARDEIGRLEELRLAALELRLEADLALGRHTETVPELEALVREHPLRESLRGLLMLALYRAGRQADALAAYQEARAALVEELGLDPSESLQRLEQAILQHDPALDPTRLDPTAQPTPATATPEPRAAPAPVATPQRERRERKVVTVVFADLAGFTAQAETMDPEDVAALLDPFHARLKRELERFGGTVEKFIGDAVMAIFGAPVAHEDDAERAVRAALSIRDWAGQEGIELRIGLNTGEALVSLNPFVEGQATARGDVVNTAARLQSAAPVGGILVGGRTFRSTERTIDYADPEVLAAKGKAQPLAAWRVVAARARIDVEQVRGAALVGRRRELELLSGAFERMRQERAPELVTLVGVPGIGKSRLVLELFNRIEQETELTSWRQGRCLPYGEGVTFWALGEIVKAELGIFEGDDDLEAERKLSTAVDDPWVESHLRPLVGLSSNADGGADRRDEAFTAWRRFIEGLADEWPLVLVFEDIHWADKNLLDFIDHLIDWATGVPLLVVCTARPELLARHAGWSGGKPNAITVSLSPLSDGETGRLLGDLLERSVLPADMEAELLARAGGNPLYAEELARAVREGGRADQLPETVLGMIAARLDLLELDQKELVQDAAVVGKVFWLSALARLAPGEHGVLEQRLNAVERREFVRRERASSLADDTEYSFRHVLVCDVAYEQIPRADRAQKHLRVAEWLQQLARPEDRAEMLAHHYLRALDLGAASGLDTAAIAGPAQAALEFAADRAYALNAYETAIRYYRAALDLIPEDDLRHSRLLLNLAQALFFVGEPDVGLWERARDALLAAGDGEGTGEAELRLAEHFWLTGDRAAAFAHLGNAHELVEARPPSVVKAHVIATTSRFRMLDADEAEAIRLGNAALTMAAELGLDDVRAAALNNVGVARASLGDDRGLADLAEAIEVARDANNPFEFCRAKCNLEAMYWAGGQLVRSVELLREGSDDALRFGQHGFSRFYQGQAINFDYTLGDWDEALTGANAFVSEVEAGPPHYLAYLAYSTRALIRFGRADVDGARADAEQAVVLARRAADPQAVLPAVARLAHICCELGERERAASLVANYPAAFETGHGLGHAISSVHTLSWTLTAVGRGDELASALRLSEVPWARAAIAYCEGDPAKAAEVFATMGATTEEAYARLAASRVLVGQGHRADADEQLQRALTFYRTVGASRYLDEGQTVLAVSV